MSSPTLLLRLTHRHAHACPSTHSCFFVRELDRMASLFWARILYCGPEFTYHGRELQLTTGLLYSLLVTVFSFRGKQTLRKYGWSKFVQTLLKSAVTV
jgi:hypothetical protein